MKAAVQDTYGQHTDGNKMRFDIVMSEDEKNVDTIYRYGQEYLKDKRVMCNKLTLPVCEFNHIERATDKIIKVIEVKGYHFC